MAAKLPKVTEYVKNVGKSVAFMAIDQVKENSPGITEFVSTNEDIFREVYSSVKNFRATMKTVSKNIKESNVWQAVEYGWDNVKSDLKTGKFYNDRTAEIGEHALGMDEYDDDFEVSISSEDDESSSRSDSINIAIGAAAATQATAVTEGTDMIIRGQKASTQLLMANMNKNNAALTSSIGSVYTAISTTNAILNGPMRAHMENSRRFYEENLKLTSETNLMLKELLEMQRNMYKSQNDRRDDKLGNSMTSEGGMDIRGYAKNVKDNIVNLMDSMGLGMLNMDMGGGNPYMLMTAAPFQMIMSSIGERLLSKDFKKALSSFDKGVTSMFSQFVARMNNNAKRDGSGIASILGEIFGISIDTKDDIRTGNYKKDAIPFDGKTRQAIIETIPGYLSRIEAALTSKDERHYDYETGSWKNASNIKRDFDEDKQRSILSANRDAINDIEKNLLSKMESKGKTKQASNLRKKIYKMFEKIYKDNGDFRPSGFRDDFGGEDAWDYYGGFTEAEFMRVFASMSKSSVRDLAKNNMEARQNLSRLRRNQESNGGVQRQLFNGAYDPFGFGNGQRHDPKSKLSGGTGLLALSKDKNGRNIFWYLTSIIDIIRDRKKSNTSSSSNNRPYKTKNRRRRKKSNSTVKSSDDSDPDGDILDDDVDIEDFNYEEFLKEEEERLKETEENKKKEKRKAVEDWVKKKFGDTALGGAFAKVLGKAADIVSKPMDYMTKMLNKADESMFKLMFGTEKMKDDEGNEIEGVFPAIMYHIKKTFKEVRDWFKKDVFDKIKEWFKPTWEKYGKPVTDEMKNMAKEGWDYAKGRTSQAINNVFVDPINQVRFEHGIEKRNLTKDQYKKYTSAQRKKNSEAAKAWESKVRAGGVSSAAETEGKATQKDKNDPGAIPIVESAYGRFVTKRGLTMISPGEMIIPASFDKNEQKKMLALEKRDRNRITNAIGLNAEGTVDTNKLKDQLHSIYEQNKGKGGRNIASGIFGAGAGLLMGNPLLGAMAGAGLSILSNSETFKNVVFGEVGEDGDRKGGLISKKIQGFFKRALPDMGDFGIAGGLLGLLTPFGPLGGAAIGAGIGMLKNSDGFKRMIFGDESTGKEGLLKKESVEKAKKFLLKAAPKMAIGAIAGALTGPFGLIGNVALGSGLGMLASTETFHNAIFGDKEKGTGGLFGAINRGIIDPAKEKITAFLEDFKKFGKKHVLDPLKDFWKPFKQMIKNTIVGIGNNVKDFLNDFFEKRIGLPIVDFLQEKIFKPITNFTAKLLKAPLTLLKGAIAAPAHLLGGIGNSIRMNQIRRGTANDMTAAERLQWREEHGKRNALSNKLFGQDKMLEQDKMIAGMDANQLEQIALNTRAGLKTSRELQKDKTAATSALSSEFSKFFNEKPDKSTGRTRYARDRFGEVNKILKKINSGDRTLDIRAELDGLEGLTKAERDELYKRIEGKVQSVRDATESYNISKKVDWDTDQELEKLLGHKVKGRKGKRLILDAVEAERRARREAAQERGQEDIETPEEGAIKSYHDEYTQKTDTIIDILKNAAKDLNTLANGPSKIDDISTPNDNKSKVLALPAIGGTTASKATGLMTSHIPTDAELNAQTFGSSKVSEGMNSMSLVTRSHDEDSKEATDARKDAAEDEADVKSANEAERESAGWLKKLYNKFFGDKEKNKEKGSGILGGIRNMFGGIFEWFTGKSIGGKIGLAALGLGGISLFGHLGKWFTENVWPKLKEVIFGDPNDPNDGIWGKFRTTKLGGWLDETIGSIQSKGFKNYLADDLLPGVIDKLAVGIGWTTEHVIAPLIVGLIKNLPSILASVVSGLVKGLKAAIFNKELKRGDNDSISGDTGAIASAHAASVGAMSSGVSDGIKKHVNSNVQNESISASFNFSSTNNASADKTYDANGKRLNKKGQDILFKKDKGIGGLLGDKRLTNDIYYDKDGNIALDSYYKFNTSRSTASKFAEATGRSFIQGASGFRNPVFSPLSKIKVFGKGRGITGNGRGIVGGVKTGVKGAGKAIGVSTDVGNKAGLGIYQKAQRYKQIDDLANSIVKEKGLSGKEAKKLRNELTNRLVNGEYLDTTTGNTIFDDVFGAGANISDDLKTKLGNIVADKPAMTRSGKILSKIKNSKVGQFFGNMKNKVTNSKPVTMFKSAKNAVSEATENLSTKRTALSTKIKDATKMGITKAKDAAKSGIKNTATKTKDAITGAMSKSKTGSKVLNVVDKAKDIGKGIITKIKKVFESLAENNKIVGFFAKAAKNGAGKKGIKKIIIELGEKIASSAVGKLAKTALSKVANVLGKFAWPILIAQCVADFLYGFNNADTILGVAKGDDYKINFGQKVICGLVHLVNNQLLLGLIPTDTIMDIMIDFLFPVFGLNPEELNAARDRADDILDEWNKAHPDETYSNLEDFNNKDKLSTKIKKATKKFFGNAWDATKKGAKKAWDKTKEFGGKVKDFAGKSWTAVKESKFGQAVGNAYNTVKDKIGDAGNIAKFMGMLVKNTIKSSIDPDYEWNINDHIEKDDPLAGAKKTVYKAMKTPLMVIGFVGRIGRTIFDKIKEFFAGIKDGTKDAWKDITGVAKGKYSIFSKKYWNFNDKKKDNENPLGIIGKISSTILKVMAMPQAMLGWTGSKIWAGIKKLVSGAKEGILDASTDIKSVASGKYTVFNKQYWKSDRSEGENEISKLGNIFGIVTRILEAPKAMLGWTGTKIWAGIKKLVSGAKEGILDASTDIKNVIKGQYTIFNKDYWKSDVDEENEISKLGSIIGFVTRILEAPKAMIGWTGNKIWTGIKTLVSGSKEGILDASTDIKNVMKGDYTIFNKDYWKTNNEDDDNPISKIGNVVGFATRLLEAPKAMIGWTGSKIWAGIKTLVSGSKEGILDASEDIKNVMKGQYTIFSKDYWKTNDDGDDNPISKIGNVVGFATRLLEAPKAMIGWTGSKIVQGFKNIIDGVKDISKDNKKVIEKAEKGEISVFSKDYWKITVDEDNPLGVLAKVGGFLERLLSAPMVMMKNLFSKLGDGLQWVLDLLKIDVDLDEISGGELDESGEGRRKRFGKGHAYQSDPIIGNMRYGNSTIAKSGCAPVAATNLINNINPNTMDVRTAAAFAERNGLTIPSGGTDIRYFNKFLGSRGIATSNTKNKDTIINALKSGNQVILLGKDSNNAPGTPYGTNPHFVTATGIDRNGNIIVQDPDLPTSSVTYNKRDLFRNMLTSIVTDGSRVKSRRSGVHGLGRLWGGSGDEEPQEASIDNLMSNLGNIGSDVMKYVFGDAYSALYGKEENGDSSSSSSISSDGGSINLTGNSNAEKIWNFLKEKGYSAAGAAGLMGNLYAESGLNPKNIQNSYESKYGDDDSYTKAVDNKSRGKDAFSKDSAGYGLAQWTYHTRKKGLYEATVDQGKSIGDLAGQLAYLDKELQGYSSLYQALKSTNSVQTASDRVLEEFERPAVLNYNARRNYSNTMYSQYAGQGRAISALNNYYGLARPQVSQTASNNNSIDFVTFLQTVVALLSSIAGNTAVLGKILELLSEKFDLNINRAEIEAAANMATREQTASALNDILNKHGNNSKFSKILNTADTNYLVSALATLAQE